ncbi:helix-turn-helix domain-containing protein [Salinirubellus sp. GCM10025818]|uniref:helix-turn-helix domain-containing protein n=1 Tax=Salinirubellus TaxID=2162630 RepID=UPI0030CEB2F7
MKHIRITARPDPDRAPPFVAYLLDSPDIAEARAVDWNRAAAEMTTHLYAIDGDAEPFGEAAEDTTGVEAVALSALDEPRSYALLSVCDDEVAMFGVIEEALARAGLVVRRPLVYRDGRIHGHVVGDPEALQTVLDRAPDALDLRVDEIGQFPSARANPASELSDRQWEALEAALDLGYYDQPREATHEEIAETLDCAPSTASTHLQKAEARLVHAVTGDIGVNI